MLFGSTPTALAKIAAFIQSCEPTAPPPPTGNAPGLALKASPSSFNDL